MYPRGVWNVPSENVRTICGDNTYAPCVSTFPRTIRYLEEKRFMLRYAYLVSFAIYGSVLRSRNSRAAT